MSRHFLAYWSWKENNLDDWHGTISHAGSDQFDRVLPGDWLWFVTVPPDDTGHSSGSLILLSRMQVAEVLTTEEAARKLGTNNIWPRANLHAIAEPDSVAAARKIDITDFAASLRFQTDRDRLTLENGRVNAQQLQAMRLLTPESSTALHVLWDEGRSLEEEHGPVPRFVGPMLQPDLGADEEGEAILAPLSHAIENVDLQYPEGRQVLIEHLRRERNRTLVKAAKRAFLQEHGRLFCEACDFDFTTVYGDLGQGYIDAHHKISVAELRIDATTRIEDLAMVCANCHRMLHASNPLLSVEGLRALLKQVRSNTA